MDFIPLIDLLGEEGAVLAGGLVIGLCFGFFAQRSAYCTRSAVLDLARGRGASAMATWLAGFAAALLCVQLLIHSGMLSVAESRFMASPQSLSGALIGGGLFGIGMAMTRGCVSRLVVLAGSGNLRAWFAIAIVAIVGFATIEGVLVPWRNVVGGLWSTAQIGGNDLSAHLGIGAGSGLVIGTAAMIIAILLAFYARLSPWRALGGAAVGLTVAACWFFTFQISAQMFDPIPVESLSFIRPVAGSGAALVDWSRTPGIDQGVIAGVLIGALVGALAFGEFRIATFSEPGTPSILRYAAGAALMGFGGVLAGGCTVGAGLQGGSILALAALAALAAMMAGAILADRFLDRAS